MEYSPAKRLMGRFLRSTLPSYSTVLQPAEPKNARSKIDTKKTQYYNRGAKWLPELHLGSTGHMETEQGWHPAVVTAQGDESRSYDTVPSSGQCYRCNRRHLRKTLHSTQMQRVLTLNCHPR
ncbi:hypothetical protein N1851_006680 [Merluccius polli]|uniref:Uncharacterized protein n=1 Tax=Merluccius polli TaxID=89951 RepID=A0AA47P8B4_MERPO|nr:hypothetical protein N1851_006680 [Merluccius polli]